MLMLLGREVSHNRNDSIALHSLVQIIAGSGYLFFILINFNPRTTNEIE